MWLLDVNLPNGLVGVFEQFGIAADTSVARNWRNLTNGDLSAVAYKAGFKVILTKDRVFGELAGKVLKAYPSLAIVILRIPQSRKSTYLLEFERCWRSAPIVPKLGSVIEWP